MFTIGYLIVQFILNISILYALNLGALGTFSPLRIRSAPTFFPSLGQPYFGPKRLCTNPQELPRRTMAVSSIRVIGRLRETARELKMVDLRFMGWIWVFVKPPGRFVRRTIICDMRELGCFFMKTNSRPSNVAKSTNIILKMQVFTPALTCDIGPTGLRGNKAHLGQTIESLSFGQRTSGPFC